MVKLTSIERGELGVFAAFHACVCLSAGLFAPARALVAALVVSFLSALRYLFMALAVESMGRQRMLPALFGSMWMTAFVALGVVLYFFGRRGEGLLPWAGAAALAGPASFTLFAMGKGLAILFSGRGKEAVL